MEETMKCLKNTKTGNIVRVSDIQAYQMAGNQWKYVPKTEWKGSPKEETISESTEVVVSNKSKEKKSKKVSK
jgi:hypothetical protein